jgi:hypothetical protein
MMLPLTVVSAVVLVICVRYFMLELTLYRQGRLVDARVKAFAEKFNIAKYPIHVVPKPSRSRTPKQYFTDHPSF